MPIIIKQQELQDLDFQASDALQQEWVISGSIDQYMKLNYISPDEKFLTMIWENRCSLETKLPNYPVDECFTVIAGNVEIEMEDGSSTQLGPGDTGVIEKGSSCIWRQKGALRKFATMYVSGE